MSWQKLDKTQSTGILNHIAMVSDPHLFSGGNSDASVKSLPFYQDYMVYRITNYATLPSFSLDFLSDGESFFMLDGSPSPLNIVNAKGSLYLSESTVIDYVAFYLANIRGEDGDIYLINDIEALPFIDSLANDQKIDLQEKHENPTVMIDDKTNHFIVSGDLYYDGTLLKAAIIVDSTGQLEIKPRDMIMTSKPETVQFRGESQ